METLEQIQARFRIEYPFPQFRDVDGVPVSMTQQEYDQWILESAQSELARQQEEAAEAARRELRRQVRQARNRLTAIENTSSFTTNSRDNAIRDTAMILNGLIGIIIDAKIIEIDSVV